MKFSIVSYMDDTATHQIRTLQRTLSEITGSKASLESWEPHVTIGDGIQVNENATREVRLALQEALSSVDSFTLTLKGFGYIDNRTGGLDEITTPYVIYIDVVQNDQLLKLVERVHEITNTYDTWYSMPQPYTPHVTLAFRDLHKEGYLAGMEYLNKESIEITTEIAHVSLVEKLPESDPEYTRIPLNAR